MMEPKALWIANTLQIMRQVIGVLISCFFFSGVCRFVQLSRTCEASTI